ncbi:MAG: YlxR family protein [Metamycoplasmataceae bacterium]
MSKKEIFRKCIITNKIINVNDMIRIVRDKNNNFFIDINKNIQGRGAYITNEFELIMQALEKKILNKTFRSNISNDVYSSLKQEVKENEENKSKKQ